MRYTLGVGLNQSSKRHTASGFNNADSEDDLWAVRVGMGTTYDERFGFHTGHIGLRPLRPSRASFHPHKPPIPF
jgi:hypothetical protein